ncbi:MAG TPA: hypothetical protein VG839_00400 [Asticcacaulis sp.]|nr:hypothetical protein [Asticcacaulis sp.]
MATTQTSDNGGTNAAIIILAVIIIAAIAVGAVWYMNMPASTNTNTHTTDRYVSRVEQVPAQAGQAAKDATAPTANPPSQDTAPAAGADNTPTPAPAPAQ